MTALGDRRRRRSTTAGPVVVMVGNLRTRNRGSAGIRTERQRRTYQTIGFFFVSFCFGHDVHRAAPPMTAPKYIGRRRRPPITPRQRVITFVVFGRGKRSGRRSVTATDAGNTVASTMSPLSPPPPPPPDRTLNGTMAAARVSRRFIFSRRCQIYRPATTHRDKGRKTRHFTTYAS